MDRWPDISALQPDEAGERARREALIDELRGQRRRRRTGPGVRKLAVGLAAAFALSGGAALAAGLFSAADVSLEAGIGCYSRPELGGGHLRAVSHASADPVAKCAKYWREGRIGGDRAPTSPHLVACTEEGAGVSVFPGPDGLCKRLGLEPLPAGFAAAGQKAGRAYAAWFKFLMYDAEVPWGECRSPQEVVDQTRARLAKTEYGDVRVAIRGDEPCATMINPEGAALAVLTTSRTEVRQRGLLERASSELEPLLDKTVDSCIAPAWFEAAAKKKLARAGLSEVKVRILPRASPAEVRARVIQRNKPCVGGVSGASPGALTLFVDGESRRQWKWNSIGRKKTEKAQEKYERSKR